VNVNFQKGRSSGGEDNADEKESCQEKGGEKEIVHYNRNTLWPSQRAKAFS